LSKKHRLEFHEVKHVLQELEKTVKKPSGAISLHDFGKFVGRVFENNNVPPELINAAFAVSDKGEFDPLDVDGFLAWYMQNMFCQVAQLLGDKDVTKSNALVDSISKSCDVAPAVVDKVKKIFDKFDVDRGGSIDYEEFGRMVAVLVGAKIGGDISQSRIKSSWAEIDRDGSGEVDFPEFVTWYVKYFNEGENASEAFYGSFNPSAQRQNYLGSIVD